MHASTPVRARFLALGDSYTIGEGVAESARWPVQLVARVRAHDIALDDPQIIAHTGWSTDELAATMATAPLRPPYALVTLLIGVNDQYRHRNADEFGEQFHALLLRAIELAGGDPRRVIVISIPDWGVTPFARAEGRDTQDIATAIDAFNERARGYATLLQAHFVDVTGLSRDPEIRGLLAADGLHPSGAQYARWLAAIVTVVLEILGR